MRKKSRRIIGLLCCGALLLTMLLFTACAHSSPEGALKAYIKAQDDASTKGIVELVPPDFYDYQYNLKIANGHTEAESKKMVEDSYKPFALINDVSKLDKDFDPAKDISYDYTIKEKYTGSKSEVKEFNEYVKRNMNFDIDADSIVLIKYTFSRESKNERLSVKNISDSGVALKISGKWYYLNNGMQNQKLWADAKGLKFNDGAEWIFNWLNSR